MWGGEWAGGGTGHQVRYVITPHWLAPGPNVDLPSAPLEAHGRAAPGKQRGQQYVHAQLATQAETCNHGSRGPRNGQDMRGHELHCAATCVAPLYSISVSGPPTAP